MKTTVYVSSLILITGLFAFAPAEAQQRADISQRGHSLQLWMLYTDQLDLSEAQKTEVANLMASYRQEMRGKRGDRRAGDPELRQRRMAYSVALMDEVITILTPEQVKQVEKLAEAQTQGREEMREKVFQARVMSVTDTIGLSDEKSEKVMEIMKAQHAEMGGMRAGDQRGDMSRDDRQAFMEHHRETQEKLRAVLSEEEFTEWQEHWMPGRGEMRRGEGMRERGGDRRQQRQRNR